MNSDLSRRSFCSRLLSLEMANVAHRNFRDSRFLRLMQAASHVGLPGAEPQITFRDVAAEAGIMPNLVCGTPEKKYIIEVNGTGCVWFDYNNDGYVDLYIVNGSTIERLLTPSSATSSPRN